MCLYYCIQSLSNEQQDKKQLYAREIGHLCIAINDLDRVRKQFIVTKDSISILHQDPLGDCCYYGEVVLDCLSKGIYAQTFSFLKSQRTIIFLFTLHFVFHQIAWN